MQMVRRVSYLLCLLVPGKFCHFHHPANTCVQVQTHTCLHAISLLLFVSPPHLPHSIHSAGGQRSLLYQVTFIKFKTISEQPRYHSLYNNEMKKTMKNNTEHCLCENRLGLRKLGKGLLLKGWQPNKAIHCYCWLATKASGGCFVDLVCVGTSQACALQGAGCMCLRLVWHWLQDVHCP